MIRLDGPGKRYDGQASDAVAPLDLDIRRCHFAMFAGPFGCGRTTALRTINRLVEPTGEVFATDDRVDALGLTVLEGDKKCSAVYNPAPPVRRRSSTSTRGRVRSSLLSPPPWTTPPSGLCTPRSTWGSDTPEVMAKHWLQTKGFVK